MAKTVRMSDIGEHLGVSTVTVSKALSNQKGVSDQMRAKIKEVADSMGYKPPSTTRTEERRNHNIGVLVAEAYIEKYLAFYWEMYQNVNMEAVKRDSFVMLEIVSAEDERECVLPKLVQKKRVDGLMLLGGMQKDYLRTLYEEKLPIIYMDFYDGEEQDDCVISNSFYGSHRLVNYLFSMGHRNIAFVGTVLATDSITDRYLGYMKAMMENGEKVREEWVIPDRGENRICYDTILLPDNMPSAFFCNCDLTAGKLIRSLQEKGYRVPEDVSVVGYDDYIFPGTCDVEITTYAVDVAQMARVGVSVLLKKINGSEYQKGHHIVEGRLVIKDSVKRFDN